MYRIPISLTYVVSLFFFPGKKKSSVARHILSIRNSRFAKTSKGRQYSVDNIFVREQDTKVRWKDAQTGLSHHFRCPCPDLFPCQFSRSIITDHFTNRLVFIGQDFPFSTPSYVGTRFGLWFSSLIMTARNKEWPDNTLDTHTQNFGLVAPSRCHLLSHSICLSAVCPSVRLCLCPSVFVCPSVRL